MNRRTRVAEAYKNLFAVDAYEDVKTAAGTFKREINTSNTDWGVDWELESYSLK